MGLLAGSSRRALGIRAGLPHEGQDPVDSAGTGNAPGIRGKELTMNVSVVAPFADLLP
jgi:hypothetical protein